jgi:hypothetical protein
MGHTYGGPPLEGTLVTYRVAATLGRPDENLIRSELTVLQNRNRTRSLHVCLRGMLYTHRNSSLPRDRKTILLPFGSMLLVKANGCRPHFHEST